MLLVTPSNPAFQKTRTSTSTTRKSPSVHPSHQLPQVASVAPTASRTCIWLPIMLEPDGQNNNGELCCCSLRLCPACVVAAIDDPASARSSSRRLHFLPSLSSLPSSLLIPQHDICYQFTANKWKASTHIHRREGDYEGRRTNRASSSYQRTAAHPTSSHIPQRPRRDAYDFRSMPVCLLQIWTPCQG